MAGPMPQTPGGAPPNFYQMAAQGNTPGGGQPGSAGATPGGATAGATQGQTKDPDQEFLEMVTKLLSVMGKMQDMKPRGQDISKGMEAAKDAIKTVVEGVFGQSEDAAGTTGNASDGPGPGSSMAGADGGGAAGAMGTAA